MDFTKNIPKYKPKLLSLLLTLAIAVTTFIQYPITAYAADAGEEIIAKAVAGVIVDITGQDGSQSSLTIQNGIKYNRTGYLCYLLQEDGGLIPGMQAHAFYCPNPKYIAGSKWMAVARVGGYTAAEGTWKAAAPWNMPPFNEDASTNQAAIEAWMKEMDGNSQNGVQFVYDNWSEEIAEGFHNGEYVLVIETLMNFQYSVKTGTTPTIDPSTYKNKLYEAIAAKIYAMPRSAQQSIASIYGASTVKELIERLTEKAVDRLETELANSSSTGGTYEKKGIPFIGTVPNILDYRTSLGIGEQNLFSKYTNKNAPFAEMILPGSAGEQAGFTAWTGSTSSKLTDAQVQQYGVAMFVIKALDDGIPTWDSITYPTGDVGPAPTEPKGKYNIVKNYYTKDGETGEFISDDGCFIREGVVPTIHVINEPQYQVVGYKTSTTTQSIPSNLWDSWSPPNPQKQKKSTGTVKLESPETCIYVLLERIENPEPEVIDYNYILKESQITRRVYFSFPDEDTAKYKDSPQSNMNSPYIYEHEFRWLSPKVPICKGHPYMDDCPWHDPGCNENCLEDCDIDHSFQHDYDCVEATAYCKDPDWEEKRLLLSINNALQEDYQNVLVPQATWNREVELEKETKHYYKDDQPFDRQVLEDIEWHPESGGYPNWDYICVLMRGADKLTLAEWENHGEGNQDGTEADLLVNVSEAGFTMANQDSGTRKTLDYYEKFNAKFDNETPRGVYFFAHFLGMSHVKLSKIFKVGSSCRKQGDCYFFIII